jgi:hypothetical protein
VSALPRIPLPETAAGGRSDSERDLIANVRAALRALLRTISARAEAEAEVNGKFTTSDAAADREYQQAKHSLADKVGRTAESDRRADEIRRRSVVDAAIKGEADAKSEFARNSRKIASDFDSVRELAKNEYARAKDDTATAFELGERKAAAHFAEARKPIDDANKLRESFSLRLEAVFADYRKFGLHDPPTTHTRESFERFEDPVEELILRLSKVDKPLTLLEGLFIPRAMKGNRWIWIVVVLFLIVVYPLVQLQGPTVGFPVALVAALVLGFLLRTWLVSVSKSQVSQIFFPLAQTLVDAESLAGHCMAIAENQLKEKRAKVAARRDEQLQSAKKAHSKALADGEATRDERLRRINEVYAQRIVDIQTAQQVGIRDAVELNERKKSELRALQDSSSEKLDAMYHTRKDRIRSRYATSWQQLETEWRTGIEQATAATAAVGRAVDAIGPDWDDPSWADRPFPANVPPVVRFGAIRLKLADLPQGVPADPRLREGVAREFTFPCLLPFPDRANLLIDAPREGRSAALGLLQAAMFRLLTSLPPGQVRFTIVDPIGIGRNFGAFMHLADFDEALVNQQVWTEPRQIEERLADLSAHMEKVTQKYLRNEYESLGEYNAVAGEVAEPYRVLVVADFPTGFDEKALARLAGIVDGGIPCGVLTLIALDRDRPLPAGFTSDDFRRNGNTLSWEADRLEWTDPDFGAYRLTLDSPPPAEFATRLIQRTGAAAKEAKRVEVPFEFIAPPDADWWTSDSRGGVDVPLGKAGATKRQHLALGHGTSQHVLIAGRTGSGKSTLLHALVTNLALNYSPDQVDLYLIDFKKGVEFKVYASHELPHASVVAIESEREFGISVLQRLDAEMRLRGERFRDAGVQDLTGYRDVAGAPPLPRLLLIVDEFQEFFVEEDRLAQEAALLLDRLVRQGRAFGVHVILGSQSLGGAYALARSTLGQMAVRIALQCSESDAQLILSEQNPSAKLLSRPGEAVYNDANGAPEGNHFFQVVWLPDDRREVYLKRIDELARARPPVLARKPIVFEGDAPADIARNPLLKPLLESAAWPASPRSAQAWLGDAVAIKDPTSAVFRRQGANHLLIVGQNDESALGIMGAALLGLAAQYPPAASETVRSGARFAVLDGTPEDHPQAEFLARVAGVLPHPLEVGRWRDSARILAAFAEEVKRRGQPEAPDGPELFLLIHDLPRFRDLRRREDDFGFGRREEDASPSDNLGTILTDGPGLGVHVLTWCDNLNNLNRVFTHQMLREFGMRVLFQMSPNDSGHLLDAPYASKLGPHRALYVSEEQNRLEKFRPYGLPGAVWLEWVGAQLRNRAAVVE